MNFIKRVLGSLEARLSQPRLSVWRTLYVNLRTLPIQQAIKFPIYIYGKHKLFLLNGKINITPPPSGTYRGMIKIGINGDSFSLFDGSGFLQLACRQSIIEFNGPCRIALNTKIRVCAGVLRLGAYSRIGSDTRIICNGGSITIGDFSGITFGCQVINSGFHYIYDAVQHGYINRTKDIVIGPYNWIGNNTTISGGTVTNEHTIVCQKSLLNKDYSSFTIPSMLAGSPANVVRTGLYRVFSPETEEKIANLFKTTEKAFVRHEEFPDNALTIVHEM